MRIANRRRFWAFTLIELLVVMAVIAVLVAILVPAVMYVRNGANRVKCQDNLRQIGIAMRQYRDVNSDYFPYAAQMPSLTPQYLSMVEVLADWIEGSKEMFHCPLDQKYFKNEGISYEYPASRLAGIRVEEVLRKRNMEPDDLWFMYDFEAFHGKPGADRSRNFLFSDGHVDSF